MSYVDANADAPVLPAAWEAYAEAAEDFANPSSLHALGRAAHERLARARAGIAAALGAEPGEVVLTSGGTEADALAIHGLLAPHAAPHVVTSAVEHAAVAATLDELAARGRLTLTRVPAGRDGRVAAAAVVAALRPETRLVSLVLACNETGVLQPVAEVAEVCRARGIAIHTDAVQAIGRTELDAHALGVDALSLSAHKLGAVGGVGVLYLRHDGAAGRGFAPLVAGGGQEEGRRAGTENIPGAASLAAALAQLPTAGERALTAALRDRLEAQLVGADGVELLGARVPRLCNTSCARFAGCAGDGLMMALDLAGFCVSTGSACSSGSVEASPILLGMGLTPDEAREAIRFSLAREATAEVIDRLAAETLAVVARARAIEATGR